MGNIIDLDVTIFIQLANFLITIVVLNILLIRPVRRQIAERAALTAGYASDIDQFNTEADARLAAYEDSLAEARFQAAAARETMKAEGRAREREILGAAQDEARAFLLASRAEVSRQSTAAMNALMKKVDAFASGAAAKMLNEG